MKPQLDTLVTEVRRARLVVGLSLGILVGLALLIGNAIAAQPASAQDAQTLWVSRTEVVKQLANRYAEAPTQIGVTDDGNILELFTAPEGKTWTLVVTLPNGMSRVIATGESWAVWPLPKKGRVS